MGFAYTSHTPEQIAKMLRVIGIKSEEELFSDIPPSLRLSGVSDKLPLPHSELDISREMDRLCAKNAPWSRCVLGAGHYAHYIPSAVKLTLLRSEFYTSYTPYQPEFSQGTLQALFEYQSLITRLTGLPVSNASEYDGATALGSALFMTTAARKLNQPRVFLSPTLHPDYAALVRTYAISGRFAIHTLSGAGDVLDPAALAELTDKDILVTQYPNCLGYLEDLAAIGAAREKQNFQWVTVTYPIALGALESPGGFGADVVVGDGQSLANGLSLGGPSFGFLTAKQDYLRQMPGRMVGQTRDLDGKRGYVLTLQTREQHIRREKATSNICTNQTLNALHGAMYLALLGPVGLRQLALTCAARARLAASLLGEIPGVTVHNDAPFFNEFVVDLPKEKAAALPGALLKKGTLGPLVLSRWFKEREGQALFAFTELLSEDDVRAVAAEIKEVLA